MNNMRVLFGFGTSASYATEMKEPNKLYFCSDTQEIYLGASRYAFGKDINIQITGSGDTVAGVTWDINTKTLNIVLGDAGDAESVVEAIQSALITCIKNISSSMNSAIKIDSSNKDNVEVALEIAEGQFAGNVQLSQSWHGLRADANIPSVPVEGVTSGDKILSLTNKQLSTTLTITTEKDVDQKQYIILRGIGGVEISKFDASMFITSGLLLSATIEEHPVSGGAVHTFLVLTFLTADGGTDTVEVDLEDLIDVYSAAVGGGLSLSASNAFSITNVVAPNTSGLNTDQTITFGSAVVLNTITYDSHGSITGTKSITLTIPELNGGSVGTSGSISKVLTYTSIDGDGDLIGETADVVNSTAGITSGSTDSQVPTAKAVYDLVDAIPDYVGEQGVNVSGNTISLPQEFYDYLVQQTFATPTITTFTVTGLGTSAEIGTSVSVTGFTHAETNVSNIDGTLTFKHGSTTLKSGVSPSTSSTSVTLDVAETVTRSSAGTETFTLSGLDRLGNTITKSVTKSFYVPKFLGYNAAASITAADVLNMTKGQTLPTSITLPSTAYIYFVTDGSISSVKDADTGFGVPIESPVNLAVSINGVSVNYHVYRTSDSILAGTYHFIIT